MYCRLTLLWFCQRLRVWLLWRPTAGLIFYPHVVKTLLTVPDINKCLSAALHCILIHLYTLRSTHTHTKESITTRCFIVLRSAKVMTGLSCTTKRNISAAQIHFSVIDTCHLFYNHMLHIMWLNVCRAPPAPTYTTYTHTFTSFSSVNHWTLCPLPETHTHLPSNLETWPIVNHWRVIV